MSSLFSATICLAEGISLFVVYFFFVFLPCNQQGVSFKASLSAINQSPQNLIYLKSKWIWQWQKNLSHFLFVLPFWLKPNLMNKGWREAGRGCIRRWQVGENMNKLFWFHYQNVFCSCLSLSMNIQINMATAKFLENISPFGKPVFWLYFLFSYFWNFSKEFREIQFYFQPSINSFFYLLWKWHNTTGA